MSKVKIEKGESLENALRRFKKKLVQEGTFKKLKAKDHYEKPSERKKRKMRKSMGRR